MIKRGDIIIIENNDGYYRRSTICIVLNIIDNSVFFNEPSYEIIKVSVLFNNWPQYKIKHNIIETDLSKGKYLKVKIEDLPEINREHVETVMKELFNTDLV